MRPVRIIPVLLLRRQGLVKTTRFEKPEYVGDPINVVRIFNDKEVDELMLLEITKTKAGAPPDFAFLEQIVSEAFMPVGYGGGVRSVDDARRLLRLGIEKISLNTAALVEPTLVTRLRDAFGAQCVVASVDVKKKPFGGWEVFSHAGAKVREKDPLKLIDDLVKRGAGEVLVTAVHRDGTMGGMDRDLARMLDGRFDVPVVVAGGASGFDDMKATLAAGPHLSALGVGARFVYHGPYRAVLVSYLEPRELRALRR